jgi:uncharacterized protein (TIGR00369 family)
MSATLAELAELTHGVVAREVLTAGTGLAFVQGLLAGDHPPPPFSRATGIYLREVAEGRVVFAGTPSAEFLNPIGTVHGGWTSAILDSAMACAVHTTLKAGEGYTTVEMKINFVSARSCPTSARSPARACSSTAAAPSPPPRASSATAKAASSPTAARPA